MHIVLLGAGGNVAQRIVVEALDRGHQVTGVVRELAAFESYDPRLKVVQGDALAAASVANVAKGADAIINAISPRPSPYGLPESSLSDAARAVIAGAQQAQVKRLIIVGGAGSLLVAPGLQLMNTPTFPPLYKPEAMAQAEALAVYHAEAKALDWTYISPAAETAAGTRTGHYRTGADQLLADAQGHSRISFEDYAIAVIDMLEQAKHFKRRITVAY